MVLGLLLVLLSGGAIVALLAYNRSGGPEYTVMLFDNEVFVANGMQIFIAGMALALVFCLGLWMMAAGARRRRAIRAEIKAARHDAQAAEARRDEAPTAVMAPSTGRADEGEPHHHRRRFFHRRHETPDETHAASSR
jgi:hypothetical protein